MSTQVRESFLDLLRILASFLVIVNHTNSAIFLQATPGSMRWFFSTGYFFVSKIAVPIFFMISGYLLLKEVDTWEKALKRVFRIISVLFFCAIIYSLYNNIYVDSVTAPSVIIKRILIFFRKPPSNALWYLYAYLGILLMLPFLQKMVHMMDKKDYHIFFIVSGTVSGFLPILSHYCDGIRISSYFQVPLFAGSICMLLIGQYFKRFSKTKTKFGFCFALLVFILMVFLNVTLTFFESEKSNKSYLFFDNINLLPILLESISCFYVFTFFKFNPKISAIISYVGDCTFGIYLISDMSINFLKPLYIDLCNYMHPLISVVLFEIVVFLVGLLITMLLKKIPLIKNYL